MLCALAAAAALLAPAAARQLASMSIIKLGNIDPDAVCNDGTAGAFYMHTNSDPAMADIWLIYLEGGDWCYSAQSCEERFKVSPQFMSSKGWPGIVSLGGIMDNNPQKSPWAGANKIYIGYCSSDAWVGNVAASPQTFGLAFQGQRIISATLSWLVSQRGLGGTPGQRVLFAGCSAGSRGAMFTADYVAPMLSELGVSDDNMPRIQALFDSPLWVDVLPITGATGAIVPLEVQTQAILGLVGASNRLGTECAAAYPGDEAWKCLYGQFRLPYVQTPYALNAAQFDKFQLPYNEGGNPPWGPTGLAYAQTFQDAVRSALAPLPTVAQGASAVFSAACFHHCVTQETSYWGIKVYNVSFRDVSGAWFFNNPAGTPIKYVEQCDGYKCGTCRTHRKHPDAPPDPRPKPPRAPAPPDPFAIWSPPPPMTVAKGSAAVASVGGSTIASRRAAARAAAQTQPGVPGAAPASHHVLLLLLLLLAALAVAAWSCLSRRGRRLRVQHGERTLELEVDALIGGAARRQPQPGYGAAASSDDAVGDAAAALAAFRADARYAQRGAPPGVGPGGSVSGARAPLRGMGAGAGGQQPYPFGAARR